MMGLAVLLHVIAAVIWVGGMFFAYMFLRPVAASQLEPPARLTLWEGVFGRFFRIVQGPHNVLAVVDSRRSDLDFKSALHGVLWIGAEKEPAVALR